MRSLIGVAVVLLMVACGSSGSNANASHRSSPTPSHAGLITSAIDACKLVSATDASSATGVTMQAFGQTGGAPVCIYAGQKADGTSVSVFVYAQTYSDTKTADAVSPDQVAAAFKGQFGVSDAKSVSGIGDKAFEYTATATSGAANSSGVVIFVFKANVVLLVAVTPTTDQSKAEGLARVAVGNLPKS